MSWSRLLAFEANPQVWVLVAGLVAGYLTLVGRPNARGSRGTARRQTVVFLAGVGLLWVGADWPVDAVSDRSLLSAHMVQYLLLGMIAPGVMLAGLPAWLVDRLLSPPALRRMARQLARPLVAWAVFTGVLVLSHWPAVIRLYLASGVFHLGMHVAWVASGLVLWWPVLSPLEDAPRLPPPGQMLYLFVQSMVPTVPMAFLTLGSTPLYATYAALPKPPGITAITDQRTAGLLMKLGGGAVLWTAIIVIFFRWAAAQEHADRTGPASRGPRAGQPPGGDPDDGPPRRGAGLSRAMVVLVVAVAATTVIGPAGSVASPQQELEAAEARIEELADQLRPAQRRRKQRTAQVADLQARVAELERAVNQAGRALQRQRQRAEDARATARQAKQDLGRVRGRVADRARRVYKQQVPSEVALLTGAESFEQFVDRAATVEVLAGRDQASAEQLAATRTRMRVTRRRATAEADQLKNMRSRREQLLDQALQTLARRRDLLAAARARTAALQAKRESLEEESARLEELIAGRGRSSAGQASAVSDQGLSWPVCGALTSGFGYRWGRQHEGLDIDGATGQVLRASGDGVVIFAGWRGGYGRLTLIDHGGGLVTAYAHQSRQDVADGQQVTRGQPIGAVGATGNVTGSHLHFETRVGGRAVDPSQYLPRGC